MDLFVTSKNANDLGDIGAAVGSVTVVVAAAGGPD